jgi:2-polyprenyl-6-methoxyphenol hydroxylase-like FAD-dependent oxidoreductase
VDVEKRVLIVGGGPGGLAAAIALRKVGHDVLVLEQAPRLDPIGSALQIWPHGVRGLRRIGVAEDVLTAAGILERVQFRTWKGRLLMNVEMGQRGREVGEHGITVARGHLHLALLRAVGDDAVRLGAEAVSFEHDAGGVTVTLADGGEESGAALVLADGRESKLRDRLTGPVEHRYVGQGWGNFVDFDDDTLPVGESWALFGRGDRFGITHISPGKYTWNSLIPEPEAASIGGKAEAIERFRGWAEPAERLIAATPEQGFYSRVVADFLPLERWGEGRVTLLGDAAHATTPAQGRGVSEALEDAVVLGNTLGPVDLGDGSGVAEALRAYEARRRPATAKLTKDSWRVMRMGQFTGIRGMGRNVVLRLAGKRIGDSMLSYYTHDVEPLHVPASR